MVNLYTKILQNNFWCRRGEKNSDNSTKGAWKRQNGHSPNHTHPYDQ